MRDTRTFEDFYRRHADRVYRFVFFRCGQNRAVAEDLASEIFLKALDKFDTYDPSVSRSAWIMTIARNHLINYWRDRKEWVPIGGEEEESDPDALLLDRSLAAAGREAAGRELAVFLAKLSPRERELVTLHYLDGYNYADIASYKGLTESAAKVAVHRALKRLRSSL